MKTPDRQALWAEYRFVIDAIPSADADWPHLHSLGIATLLFDARNAYISEGVGIAWQQLLDSGRIILTRHLDVAFESETAAGVPVKVGVRAVERTRRTIVFHEEVWRADRPARIAIAHSVQLVAGRDGSGAVTLPEDILGGFEAYEGRSLPFRAHHSSGDAR